MNDLRPFLVSTAGIDWHDGNVLAKAK